jgi:hypothetical protein
MLDSNKPLLGVADKEYVEFVKGKIDKLIHEIVGKQKAEVEIYFGVNESDAGISRRKHFIGFRKNFPFIKRRVLFIPNSSKEINKEITTIAIKDKFGNMFSILCNYSCHPVVYPNENNVTAHYPGVIREKIREKYGKDVSFIFLQGFSGDIRPRVIKKADTIKEKIKKIILGNVGFGSFNMTEFKEWASSIANMVLGSIEKLKRVEELEFKSFFTTICLDEVIYFRDDKNSKKMEIRVFYFNKKNAIIMFSAEPVNEYLKKLRNVFKDTDIICVGYMGDVFGYLPVNNMIKYGGYEVEDFFKLFNIDGRYKEKIESKLLKKINEINLEVENVKN